MRPFLKWAGNKHTIAGRIKDLLPPGARLIEPFAGSGAVFLATDYPRYLLSDANSDLINLFSLLRDERKPFIDHVSALFAPESNKAEVFYERRERFNRSRDPRERAAYFVYLNRHCFNGLCRYNSQGEFNTPFGKYSKVYFPEQEMTAFSAKAAAAEFRHEDFEAVLGSVEPGDVVYCDPPYVPLSPTACFTSYATSSFGAERQQRLAVLANELAARGIPVLISNHSTAFTREIYSSARCQELLVRRSISCKGDGRGRASELLALFSPA